MKAALLLGPIALIGGCGEAEQAAHRTRPGPSETVAVPINNSVANAASAAPVPSPTPRARPKPLVSRETPNRSTAPIAYRAIGTEPFWAVTLRGAVATLERPGQTPRRFPVDREADDKAIRYVGEGFAMTVTQGPCSDGMSEAIWSDRVQIAFADGTLKGCGGVRDHGDESEEAL